MLDAVDIRHQGDDVGRDSSTSNCSFGSKKNPNREITLARLLLNNLRASPTNSGCKRAV
jgi:hypothetical protein